MSDFDARGTRLMESLQARDGTLLEDNNPMHEVAVSACRAADRVAVLEELAAEVDPWVVTDKGALVTHPVLVEVRQQATLMSRLIAALRLPDPRSGKRPQGRPLRGVHAPGKVSSLDRARMHAEGGA